MYALAILLPALVMLFAFLLWRTPGGAGRAGPPGIPWLSAPVLFACALIVVLRTDALALMRRD